MHQIHLLLNTHFNTAVLSTHDSSNGPFPSSFHLKICIQLLISHKHDTYSVHLPDSIIQITVGGGTNFEDADQATFSTFS
jgi:hypothetical protein